VTRGGIQDAAQEWGGVVVDDAGKRHSELEGRLKAFLVSYVEVAEMRAVGIEGASFEAQRIRGGRA
jgi:hypothetical protein